MPTAPHPRAGLLPIGALTLLGLLARLPSWGNSLFGDELSTYSIVTGHDPGQIVHILNGHSVDLTPPLFFELAWLAARIGRSPELLRLFPLLAGVAAIGLTYRLGLRLVGRPAALSGAALIAFSPFLIFYSTEARAYSVVMVLALGSTLALLRALDTGRGRWWTLYAALSALAVYCHYTAVFILAVQAVWAAVTHRQRLIGLVAANLAAALAFAPWLPALAKNRHSFGVAVFNIIDPFTAADVGHDVAHWALGAPYLPLSTEPGTAALILFALAGVVALAGVILNPPRALRADAALPWLLALALPAGLAVYSLLGQSAWDGRNLISSWPGAALAAGAVLTRPRGRLRIAAVALAGVGLVLAAVGLLPADHQRPDYAAAAAYIAGHGSARDPVAVIAAPSPGPETAMDAALAYAGQPGRPLLRVGSPQLAQVLAAPPYAFLPATPTARLVAQTAAAPGDGRVFVVALGTAPLSALLGPAALDPARILGPIFGTGISGRLYSTVFGPLRAYLRALTPRYRPVLTRRLPGFLPLSLYVLDRR